MEEVSISQQKQDSIITHSATTSSIALEKLASAYFCASDQSNKISCIDFQPAELDTDESQVPGNQSSSDQFSSTHSSDQQAISSSTINQANDTLLSVVNPHLWRENRFHGLRLQQGSILSLDHSKLLADQATRNSKVSLCLRHEPEQQSANYFSRNISGTCSCRSVSSGAKSSNVKKRLKWTADLHEEFVNCVNLPGGAEKATPRAILKLMKSNGLTVLHIKSHLQKYRYAKCIPDPAQGKHQRVDDEGLPMLYLKSGMQVKAILQMQLEVQRHLCEQLEIQQNLQQAIEEQGKKIQMMLEQLRETNKAY